MEVWGRLTQISARAETGSSARATAILVCGGGEMVVKEQEQLGTGHGRSHSCQDEQWDLLGSILNAIAWSPDLEIHTSSSSHGQRQIKIHPPRSLNVMATLQSKSSIISRSSFAALDVEEPESEEEPEVVELQPVQ